MRKVLSLKEACRGRVIHPPFCLLCYDHSTIAWNGNLYLLFLREFYGIERTLEGWSVAIDLKLAAGSKHREREFQLHCNLFAAYLSVPKSIDEHRLITHGCREIDEISTLLWHNSAQITNLSRRGECLTHPSLKKYEVNPNLGYYERFWRKVANNAWKYWKKL